MIPQLSHPLRIQSFLSSRKDCETKLRLVKADDCDFILALRLDPDRSKNISQVSSDRAKQMDWLSSYLVRFQEGQEAYFVIEHKNEAVGLVRTYDYLPEKSSFCWGSWIIKAGSASSISYRSALLIYDLAFGFLNFAQCHFDVRQANETVWGFHERMGAVITEQNELDRFYLYTPAAYLIARNRLSRFTQGMSFSYSE